MATLARCPCHAKVPGSPSVPRESPDRWSHPPSDDQDNITELVCAIRLWPRGGSRCPATSRDIVHSQIRLHPAVGGKLVSRPSLHRSRGARRVPRALQHVQVAGPPNWSWTRRHHRTGAGPAGSRTCSPRLDVKTASSGSRRSSPDAKHGSSAQHHSPDAEHGSSAHHHDHEAKPASSAQRHDHDAKHASSAQRHDHDAKHASATKDHGPAAAVDIARRSTPRTLPADALSRAPRRAARRPRSWRGGPQPAHSARGSRRQSSLLHC